jgi:hypothetical protein
MANYSTALHELPTPESGADHSSVGTICRVAFVSKSSLLVASVLKELRNNQVSDDPKPAQNQTPERQSNKMSAENLLALNNGQRLGCWILVWVDRDEADISELDTVLLRIDPSALFASSVDRALYTESANMMEANNQQLEQIFKMIWSRTFPARKVARYSSERNAWHLTQIDRQMRRRAIFFAKEHEGEITLTRFPDEPVSFDSVKQKRFYQLAARAIMSQDGRTGREIRESLHEYFPFQWISPTFIVHELMMGYSQDFRCDWMKEYLYWGGGGIDAVLLSFAYTIAKRTLDGIYTPRLVHDHDGSWFSLMQKDTARRVVNRRGEEVFIRIMPRSGPSD